MKATTQFREQILLGLESYFVPLGFIRKKNDPVWRKQQKPEISRKVHFNFALYEKEGEVSIIPSIEVRHEQVERLKVSLGILAKPSDDSASFGVPLTQLTDKPPYSFAITDKLENVVRQLSQDLSEKGMPFFEKLEDLDWVLENLSSEDPKKWCVPSLSLRARFIPMIWWIKGNRAKTLDELRRLKSALGNKDQIIPKMAQFEERFLQLIEKVELL